MNQIYKSYKNEAEGLKAVIAEGVGRFDYRVIFIDTDADGVVHVSFSKTFEKAEKKALEFVNMVEYADD